MRIRMRCNTDPDPGSTAASMRIRIQTQVRIQGEKNRPENFFSNKFNIKITRYSILFVSVTFQYFYFGKYKFFISL